MMETTKKHGQNEDSESCVLQIGHRFLRMGFNKNFKVRYPKRRFDEIDQKTS